MIKSWVSTSLVNGRIIGWLLDTEKFTQKKAYLIISNLKFEIICNKKRKNPQNYISHCNHGFSFEINSHLLFELVKNPKITLIDKDSGQKLCSRTISLTSVDFANILHLNDQTASQLFSIAVTNLVDSQWYAQTYLFGQNNSLSSVEHYFFIGWKKGFNPSNSFNTIQYLLSKNKNELEQYLNGADVELVCPLYDFIINRHAISDYYDSPIDDIQTKELTERLLNKIEIDLKTINQSKLFNPNYYTKQHNNELYFSNLTPDEHYYFIGFSKNYNPSSCFDNIYYLDNYLTSNIICPLVHYECNKNHSVLYSSYENEIHNKILNDKQKQEEVRLIEQSDYFDENWYYCTYNINTSIISPAVHFLYIGWKRKFNPSISFSTDYYISQNPELEFRSICPLMHYLKTGKNQGIAINETLSKLLNKISLVKKSEFFDTGWYKKQYCIGKQEPVEHYLSYGWWHGCNPSKKFNNDKYLATNYQLNKLSMPPLIHYLQYGKAENKPIFEVSANSNSSFFNELRELIASGFHKISPLISVIVTSYNYADFIEKTLDSILAQNYKNFEIIVVDDGSTDNSLEKIQNYVSKSPNIKLYTHEGNHNKGLCSSIKLGISKSNGSFIAFCESDDFWDKNYLSEKIKLLNSYPNANIIINDFTPFGDENRVKQIISDKLRRWSRFTQTKIYLSVEEFRIRNWIFTFSLIMVRKSLLQSCDFDSNPFPPNLDWWLWRQITVNNPVFYIDKQLTYWRMHRSYMASSNHQGRKNFDTFITAGDKLLYNRFGCRSLQHYIEHEYSLKNGIIYKKNKIEDYQPSFLMIMLIDNPLYVIKDADVIESINSLINQTYGNFKLMIIESCGSFKKIIEQKFSKELNNKTIMYLSPNVEDFSKIVSSTAKKLNSEWLFFSEPSTIYNCDFLETYAFAILKNNNTQLFYSKSIVLTSGKIIGSKFDYSALLSANVINTCTLCIHNSVYNKKGGFDFNLLYLKEWELNLRCCKEFNTLFIDKITIVTKDLDDKEKDTECIALFNEYNYIRKKYCTEYPVITTIITTYNHEKYIEKAINSALSQTGNFIHEILISDDASTDNTPKIIDLYAKNFPNVIKDISNTSNVGISENLKKCFNSAKGDYIALLEGDDYWNDQKKLQRQLDFLDKNQDCTMVFSRIKILKDGKYLTLDRQEHLPEKLTGENFLNDYSLNLIANFSSCCFRSKYVKTFPEILFNVRFNEISLAFYIEKYGKIGYINKILSVYRKHDRGVWSSASSKDKFLSGLQIRKHACSIAQNKYKTKFNEIINKYCDDHDCQ